MLNVMGGFTKPDMEQKTGFVLKNFYGSTLLMAVGIDAFKVVRVYEGLPSIA